MGAAVSRAVGRGGERPVVLAVVLVASIGLTGATFAGAVQSDGSSVPLPEPGVERTYDDTFRILASNDADPLYNTTTFETIEYDPDGGITVVNKTAGTLPFELQVENMRPTQALETALATDVYVTSFTDFVGGIPYRDRWETLTEFEDSGIHVATRIIPLNELTYGEPTSTDGAFRVEVLSRDSGWVPVYEADVRDGGDAYYVANPDEALVHLADVQYIVERRVEGLRALLRYSELAPDNATARERAAVPMRDGDELFPTTSGGPVARYWRSGTVPIVQDAYIGIVDVPPGAWYRGRYVTQAHQVNTYTPWDYRLAVPANYSVADTCTHVHPVANATDTGSAGDATDSDPENTTDTDGDANETYRETHPQTNWATYRVLAVDEDVNVTIGNATHEQGLVRLGGDGGVWSTYDDLAAEFHRLTPGEYTVTARLNVTVTLERRYGVRSAECRAWEANDTVTRTVRTSHTVPVTTVPADSRTLSVDVTVYDKPGDDVVAIDWIGDQDLDANPWRTIVVEIGGKQLHVDAPWQFYSVTQTTAVEERGRDGTTTFGASDSYGAPYPALLRNRVSVANVTVRLTELDDQRAWWRESQTTVAEAVPATDLPETILAPGNDRPTFLYEQYAGVYLSNDEATGEPVSVTVETPFQRLVANTSVEVVEYRASKLDLRLEEHNGTTRLAMRLVDARTGAPLPYRTIWLQGANRTAVGTSLDGTAYAEARGTVISARFDGDAWRGARPRYYLGDHEGLATGIGFTGAAEDLFGYIDIAVSNLLLIVEWLALGVFAFYWVRIRSEG